MSASLPAVETACEALGSLADPLRWRIVALLSGGERCVCDLEGLLGLTQSRLSYHLGILRKAGLLTARKDGRWMYYSVAPDGLEALASELGRLAEDCRSAALASPPRSCN